MLDTLVIGSGFSGIGMGVALRRAAREDFEIWERASDLGGTWRDNHYPGCACDITSPVYSFSFAPKPDWSRLYPPQPEILDYLRGVARDHGLGPHLRFGRDMRAARWRVDHWEVEAADGTVAKARFLVLGTGGLSNWRLPGIAGLDGFDGAVWHSAAWNHDFPLEGKRVAVVGTGASAIQFVPEIAPKVGRLTIFQRTPPWVVPKLDREITPRVAERWRRQPWRQKLLRLFHFARSELLLQPRLRRMRGLDKLERIAREHMESAIADPILRDRLTPRYRFGCKRVLISNDWYPTLARDNVELVAERIEAATPDGLRTADGRTHGFDAIVFGTGFDVEAAWKGPDIVGLGGVALRDQWADAPKAYLGISVAGYPNLFITMGPATGLGHNSIIYMIEAQIAHIISAMALARDADAAVMPRRRAQDAFFDDVQAQMADTVWMKGGCDSWYLIGKGRNYTLWPGHSFAYRRLVKRVRPADYVPVDLADCRSSDDAC
ncbi:NAD(P)/FAD-dependent oxidoreductase [Sphingosinicella sp. CPCC 101087]|uniref:flavin-containing monooxygenase n=1 Tax=Sphingosinicella sp. CPCC 101087 TaxID=2497754 RepID=UPI00101DA00E|nr:NAD(P)/FAD-dependent oxidoreductase [Sphingosinicella sp. CPCC 101087]